ncbi:MAG TPA: YCF48-related protein [Ignavibacteria bacterium]
MKKIIFTIIFTFYSLTFAKAQWIAQDSGSAMAPPLLNVKFINRNTGWVCGDNGIIRGTKDGGTNWVYQNSGVNNKSLYGLCPINANVIYCVGWFETILKSTNGGDNWIIIKNGLFGGGHSFFGTYFINENTGWVCGTGLIIFKTTNGGLSFDSTFMPIAHARDIYFRNPLEGLVCGEGAGMCRTTDGGINWTEVIMPIGTEAADFNNINFIDSVNGYTQGVGNNKLYKTTDFGISWDSVARVPGADLSYCFYFPSLYTGYCGGSYGRLFKTTNGGYNWTQQLVPRPGYKYRLYFINDTVGWCVGASGQILFTETGGQNLVQILSNTEQIPDKFELHQNYPNPFNNQTTIEFAINKNAFYKIEIFDVLGRKADILFEKYLATGIYKYNYNTNGLSSGVYFYILSSDKIKLTKTFLLIK